MNQQLFGNYKILKKIGAGGMAKVYLAVHKDVPNLKVILKVLSDDRLVERFKQEADKLALLDGNPNICRIKHFFNHGDDIVIAMEYIDGITLEDHIKAKGKLSSDESIHIIKEVLNVLEFAHSKGIYHRDIKPSNIMLDKSGNVKIIDFGIAKAESDPNLTVEGTAAGTPMYMAPEQFTPSEDTNYALVDIYAVGTTLFYMLSGELPFKGDNEFAIRDAKLFNEPPRLRDFTSGIPKELENLTLKALKKNPIDRFPSTMEMIKSIDSISFDKVEKQPDKRPKSLLSIIMTASIFITVALITLWLTICNVETEFRAPNLLKPINGTELDNNQPILTWEEIEGKSYYLEYANNEDFFISEQISNLTNNSHSIIDPLEAGTYYWRVQSTEGEITSEFSKTGYFTIKSSQSLRGNLQVSIQPNGNIYVDDNLIGSNSTGITIALDAGEHQLRLENNRAINKIYSDIFIIYPDSTTSISYRFRMPATKKEIPIVQKPPKKNLGELRIGSKPTIGAVIYIDNELQERKTPDTYKLKPGEHIIKGVLDVDGKSIISVDTIVINKDGKHRLMLDFEK